ncbi:MAG: hypothetical protein OHK0017_11980 [Patescibacteria group bacterium]
MTESSIRFKNTVEDLKAWNSYVIKHNINNSKVSLIILSLVPSLLNIFISQIRGDRVDFWFAMIFNLLVIIICYPLFRWILINRAGSKARFYSGFLEDRTLTFTDEQIIIQLEGSESKLSYARFVDYIEDKGHYYLRLGAVQALIIPKKYLSPELQEIISLKIKPNK